MGLGEAIHVTCLAAFFLDFRLKVSSCRSFGSDYYDESIARRYIQSSNHCRLAFAHRYVRCDTCVLVLNDGHCIAVAGYRWKLYGNTSAEIKVEHLNPATPRFILNQSQPAQIKFVESGCGVRRGRGWQQRTTGPAHAQFPAVLHAIEKRSCQTITLEWKC